MATSTNLPGHTWDDYREEDRLRAKLPAFRRRVERTRAIVRDWLAQCRRPYIACSGGKDSVAMLHLIQCTAAEPIPVLWYDSGVEWPGVDVVFDRLKSRQLCPKLTIVRPDVDVIALKRRQLAGELSAASKDRLALHEPIRHAVRTAGYDAAAIGLRQEESRTRALDRATHGPIHRRADGLLRCTPLADWSWQDVYAYIALQRLPLHPIYSAPLLDLEHRGRIRLSWWLSTDHWRHGELAWVRDNYPDIHARLRQALPNASHLL
jgi:3'-phosphoadenosine 5'-phosphosulfate sulfotransferase (PAPS reductase)/FAD synthetase